MDYYELFSLSSTFEILALLTHSQAIRKKIRDGTGYILQHGLHRWPIILLESFNKIHKSCRALIYQNKIYIVSDVTNIIYYPQLKKNNRWKKRGIGVALMKYPFEYFGNFYSMVSIYTGDGTVSVCHGGIEMGQGINTKVQQVAAHVLGIDIDMIQIKPANTLTAPNNFVTGGSVGSESVCYATMKACQTLLERLEPVKKEMKEYNWLTMLQLSRRFGIDLNASYQFTIKDSVKNYNIYGVTFTEVELDVLTGLVQINRVDLLEDTGESMSPEVDIGQVEGAFVMGIGYWLMEHIEYDETDGRLLNTRTWNYHPPGMKDIPIDWRIEFRKNAPNPVGVLRSKATGEPPLCMSVSIAFAIRNALFEVRKESDSAADSWFPIDGPTSTDYILLNSLLNYKDFKLK